MVSAAPVAFTFEAASVSISLAATQALTLAGSIFGLIGFWGGNAFGLPTYASSAIAAAIGLGAAVVCARSAMIRRLIAKALEFSNWF